MRMATLVLASLALAACGQSAPAGPRVFFVQPQDGAAVKSPVMLEFGAESFQIAAVPQGTVTETRCGDGPIDSATLELTELNVTPPDNPRTHIGRTNGNGEFLITGLRPQFIHFLRVRGPDTVVDSVYNPETGRWDPVLENIYSERIDYLRFLRDQVVKYDVRLGRLTSCSEPPPGAP